MSLTPNTHLHLLSQQEMHLICPRSSAIPVCVPSSVDLQKVPESRSALPGFLATSAVRAQTADGRHLFLDSS